MIVDIVWRIGNLNALPRQSPRPRPRPRGITSQTRAPAGPEPLPQKRSAKVAGGGSGRLQMRSFEYEEFAKDAVSQLPKEMPVRWTIRTERREERRCFDEDQGTGSAQYGMAATMTLDRLPVS